MNETLFAQSDASRVGSIILYLLGMALVIAFIVFVFKVMWKFHVKAGRPGWAWLVPIYNVYTLVKIAGRPGWWTVLFFIPIVNIVVAVITALDTAAAFRRSAAFGIFGLLIFSFIGYAILAFGDDTYTQPIHQN